MASKKNNQLLNFIRQNVYYIIVGVALLVTAIIITAVLLSRNATVIDNVAEKPIEQTEPTNNAESSKGENDEKKDDETSPTNGKNENDQTTGKNDENNSDDKSGDKSENGENQSGNNDHAQTDARIIFTMPIKDGTITKSFTSSTVVFNQTLGVYTGHMGVDFGAPAGSDVYCAYDGEIESVTTSYLQGTTVVISHGNGLKTVYNSIDADDDIAEGMKVTAGQKIGEVSDNNRQEYKDGPHLHFEVTLDGKKVDPETYLMIAEK
ncbi:MAG: M23 family metallopeptidase [Clostridia bacterium]|nr:M23 family metallopeptidase [Clostridia bacterium]